MAPLRKHSKVFRTLNSPFVVTLLGGLLLALVGGLITGLQKEHELTVALQQKKYELHSKAVSDIETAIMLLDGICKTNAWLLANQDPAARTPRGRNRTEVLTTHDQLWDQYRQGAKPAATLSLIKAFFKRQDVKDRATALGNSIEEFGNTLNDQGKLEDCTKNFEVTTKRLSELEAALEEEVARE